MGRGASRGCRESRLGHVPPENVGCVWVAGERAGDAKHDKPLSSDHPSWKVQPLFDAMNDLHLDSADSLSGLDPASIRILAVDLQRLDLDVNSQACLDSRSSSVVVDWGTSTRLVDCVGEGGAYDLVLIGQSSQASSVIQAVRFKQENKVGLVLLLESGTQGAAGLVGSPTKGRVWKVPDHMLSMVLPWAIELCVERKALLAEQLRMDRQLQDMEYRLEMADMASTVLHNVGNVLNSVNVAGKVLEDLTTQSSVVLINRMSDLLKEHDQDWMTFLSEDPKGKKILPFLRKIGASLLTEQQAFLKEIQGLQRHLSHVRHIILSHQAMARDHGRVESVAIEDLLEQAIELSFQPGDRHWVTIQREFLPVPMVFVDKHQILQILVNLFRNAKQAMQQHPLPMHTLTLSIRSQSDGTLSRVEVRLRDTGVGIAPEHLGRMFSRGFTTKKEGNGIGLHSSAMTLERLGGSLSVQSTGVGLGATFILAIPVAEDGGVV